MGIKNNDPTNAASPLQPVPQYHCSQPRNTIAALHAIMQSPLELQKKHTVKHTFSHPLQHCTQSCNTIAALHAIMQYQCSIARNHAMPMQTFMQYQRKHSCTTTCTTTCTTEANKKRLQLI